MRQGASVLHAYAHSRTLIGGMGSLSGVKLSFLGADVQPHESEIKLGGYVMRIPRTFPLI